MNTFKKILDEINMSDNNLDLISYSTDASRVRGKAEGVIFPNTINDVHKIIQIARRFNLQIVPRGAGTNIVGACVPNNATVIDLSRLNRIIKFESKTITVEPGMVLEDLNSFLKSYGLEFPVRPDIHQSCTIGGMIAMNTSGSNWLEIGDLENWISELEIIDGNARPTLIKSNKLNHFIGKQGITGIIISAKLNLRSIPEDKSLDIINFNTISVLMEKVQDLLENHSVTKIEYISPFCSEILDFEPKHHILVEYSSDEGEIKDKDEINNVLTLYNGLNSTLITLGFVKRISLTIPSDKFDKAIYWLKKNRIPNISHIGKGIIIVYFKNNDPYEKYLDKIVKKLEGTMISKYGLGDHNKHWLTIDQKNKLRLLKTNYDQKNIFNRRLI